MKIPFELIEPLASQLADAAALSETPEDRIAFWDYYEQYIVECGWTEKEYDEECLARLEESWLPIIN